MKTRETPGVSTPKRTSHRPRTAIPHVSADKQKRFSREETTTRILDVAEELFSRRDPAKVTVREIAEAAGVTHPLVHQYVGSKADILDAVIKRGAPARQGMIVGKTDVREVLPVLTLDIVDRKVHSRSIIRSVMDGIEYAPVADRLRTGKMLMELAARSLADTTLVRTPAPQMDPRIVLAANTALAAGWVAMEELLIRMFDLENVDIDYVRAQLGEVAAHLSALMLPVDDA